MPYPESRFMVVQVPSSKLEKLLNDLEEMASGAYDVISVTPRERSEERVVVRLTIIETEPVFDEEEIKRKLGFT